MHHLSSSTKREWNNKKRAAFIVEKVKEKAAAQMFFLPGKIFKLEIHEEYQKTKTPHFSRTYVIASTSEEFWSALEKELINVFGQIQGDAKNFSQVRLHVLLNRQSLFKQLPRNSLHYDLDLFIMFSTVKPPKPI